MSVEDQVDYLLGDDRLQHDDVVKSVVESGRGLFGFLRKFCYGALIGMLIVIIALLAPVYGGRNGLDVLQSFFDGNDTNIVSVGDEPFNNTENLGWELLDNNAVLHIWNQYNSYYFNVSNGIQFSNHYEEYWTHNVMMLGYYDNEEWKLIYRTDELRGFNKNVTGETDDYINATLWKDLSYGSYDFRLALRYHLGVNDSDLTVIPYIKNLGIAIPFPIGFGWELKDIKIAGTVINDNIRVDDIEYPLNQTLNNTYNNLSDTRFTLFDDTFRTRQILYVRWNHTLNYLVRVKNRSGEFNAPVTLFICVGTLVVDEEKSTNLNWYDATGDLPKVKSDWEYTATGGTNVQVTISKPSGTVENNLLVAAIATDGVETISAPTGWHLIKNQASDANTLITYYKVANASEGSSYTFTWLSNEEVVGSIVRLTGADITNPINVNDSDFDNVNGDPVAPDISTDVDNCVILRYHGLDDDHNSDDYGSYPVDHVGLWSKSSAASASACSQSAAYENLTLQGNAGTATWDLADQAEEWVAISIAIAPQVAVAPAQSGEVPANTSAGISLTPDLYVLCTDFNNDNLNATWWSNSSGTWQQFASNWTSFASGTNITQSFTNATVYNKKYWWSVNLSDDTLWTNETYSFTTEMMTPEIGLNSPANGSTGISITPTCNVTVWDNSTDGDSLTVKWYESGNFENFDLLDNHGYQTAANYNNIWSDGEYIYIAQSDTGISAYTFDENGTEEFWLKATQSEGDSITYDVWGNDSYIYTACFNSGIRAYTFNENSTEEFWLKATQDDGTYSGVWGDGEYIYTACNPEGIRAYTFDGTSFTLKDTQDDGTGYRDIWGDGSYIYIACSGDGIRAYTFESENFVLKDTDDAGGSYLDVWSDGTYIYCACENDGVRAYTFNENATEEFWLKATQDDTGVYTKVRGNNSYIYTACDNNGIYAYTFDGSSFTLKDTQDDGGGYCGIWINSSATYIHVTSDYDGIYAYNFSSDWVLQQTNTSVANGLYVEWVYTNASSASTQYWWKAIVNNTQKTYESWYEFTTEAGALTWQNIDSTVNGSYLNLTAFQVIDSTVNGSYINITAFQVIDSTVNGSYLNLTVFRVIDSSINGSYFNETEVWQNIDTTINGSYSNTTAWQNIDTTINGSYVNTTIWRTIDTSINGSYVNITAWRTVDITINGSYFNETIIWQTIDTTINGSYSNSTVFQVIDSTVNGSYVNITGWYIIDVTINGSYVNATAFQVIDSTVNGSYYNETIIWQNIDTSINGSYSNSTVFQIIDASINGSYINTTAWIVIDSTINGSYSNTTVISWQVIDSTVNGSYVNTTGWIIIDSTINGSYINTTIWIIINQTINGSYFNDTIIFQIIDSTVNGSYVNITIVDNITITNPYPTNGSTNIQVNTSLHFTISHKSGYIMNVTVYTGSNLTNCSALLGSFNSVSNGTYYLGYHNASNVSTEYAWMVNVTDAYGNYAQETYNFTTASTTGDIYVTGGGRYGMGMVMSFSMAFGMLFFVLGIIMFRHMKKRKRSPPSNTFNVRGYYRNF